MQITDTATVSLNSVLHVWCEWCVCVCVCVCVCTCIFEVCGVSVCMCVECVCVYVHMHVVCVCTQVCTCLSVCANRHIVPLSDVATILLLHFHFISMTPSVDAGVNGGPIHNHSFTQCAADIYGHMGKYLQLVTFKGQS